jgi:hypothetical protein
VDSCGPAWRTRVTGPVPFVSTAGGVCDGSAHSPVAKLSTLCPPARLPRSCGAHVGRRTFACVGRRGSDLRQFGLRDATTTRMDGSLGLDLEPELRPRKPLLLSAQ